MPPGVDRRKMFRPATCQLPLQEPQDLCLDGPLELADAPLRAEPQQAEVAGDVGYPELQCLPGPRPGGRRSGNGGAAGGALGTSSEPTASRRERRRIFAQGNLDR